MPKFLTHAFAGHRNAARTASAALLCGILCLPIAGLAQDFSDRSGAELYTRFCASCHGASGHGDGPVAPTLKVLVPDLTRLTRSEGGTFPAETVRRIVDGREIRAAHGARRMPVWGFEFASATISEPDAGAAQAARLIDRLVEHLRSMQRYPSAAKEPVAKDPSAREPRR